MITHKTVDRGGAALHLAITGDGPPVLLLHGWPEFWFTWEPVMNRLSHRLHLIAPDLRGFGDSDKPSGPFGPDDHARDLVQILDALGITQVGVVGHDVGGAVMQSLARMVPERLTRLLFFDFVYPGIGSRMGTPDRLAEIWYQSFNQLDVATTLVGATRESCRAYIAHFLLHWSHRKNAFDDVLEIFADNFFKPGNLAGGFEHYRASHKSRIAMMEGKAPKLPLIEIPTRVRWAEYDPLFPFAWTDRLDETFRNYDVALFPDVGHFPHREDPDRTAHEIASWFI